jgi:hypothetical protein
LFPLPFHFQISNHQITHALLNQNKLIH